ncbi:MAG: HAD-IIIA family hydrolase [Synergistaceae bacterium]|jgi:D-glycero-D-manno-heptose 1,7-bisphosphate phosphatase|nr:HAD-IIIA family hydrolase [Synergistaceae bacterium]
MGKREAEIKTGVRAVFLDRDGVINENVYYERWDETEGPLCPEDVSIAEGAFEGMRRLAGAGFLLFIVSNQGAFAKGKVALSSVIKTARRVESLIRRENIDVTEAYYSYGHPRGVVEFFSGESLERKPNPYFLKIAEASYDIDMPSSWMIGDRDTDVECGRLAGCKTVRIVPNSETGGGTAPDLEARNLADAASMIVETLGLRPKPRKGTESP